MRQIVEKKIKSILQSCFRTVPKLQSFLSLFFPFKVSQNCNHFCISHHQADMTPWGNASNLSFKMMAEKRCEIGHVPLSCATSIHPPAQENEKNSFTLNSEGGKKLQSIKKWCTLARSDRAIQAQLSELWLIVLLALPLAHHSDERVKYSITVMTQNHWGM